jgi:hypothetical protein
MMLERGSWLTEGKLPAKLGEDEELSSQPPLEMAADKLSLFQWRELCGKTLRVLEGFTHCGWQ